MSIFFFSVLQLYFIYKIAGESKTRREESGGVRGEGEREREKERESTHAHARGRESEPMSLALAGRFFTTALPRKPNRLHISMYKTDKQQGINI